MSALEQLQAAIQKRIASPREIRPLAFAAKVAPHALLSISRGATRPRVDTAERIAAALGLVISVGPAKV